MAGERDQVRPQRQSAFAQHYRLYRRRDEGGTFGLAVDAHDNAWFGTYGGKSIAVFDKTGKPLTPPEGITFGGRLGLMQGVIATPNGDVWALGISKEPTRAISPAAISAKGGSYARATSAEPCKSMVGPFHLAIDQQDRIWVTNGFAAHVTRFPASDPSKAEKFGTGWSPGGHGYRQSGQCLGDLTIWATGARRGLRSD